MIRAVSRSSSSKLYRRTLPSTYGATRQCANGAFAQDGVSLSTEARATYSEGANATEALPRKYRILEARRHGQSNFLSYRRGSRSLSSWPRTSTSSSIEVGDDITDNEEMSGVGKDSMGDMEPTTRLDIMFQVAPPYPSEEHGFEFLEVQEGDNKNEFDVEKAGNYEMVSELPTKDVDLNSTTVNHEEVEESEQTIQQVSETDTIDEPKNAIRKEGKSRQKKISSPEEQKRRKDFNLLRRLNQLLNMASKQDSAPQWERQAQEGSPEQPAKTKLVSVKEVYAMFSTVTHFDQEMSPELYLKLIDFFTRRCSVELAFRVFASLETVLARQESSSTSTEVDLCKRDQIMLDALRLLCQSIGTHASVRLLDQVPRQTLHSFAERLFLQLKNMKVQPFQAECLPELLLSIVVHRQRDTLFGNLSREIYEYLQDKRPLSTVGQEQDKEPVNGDYIQYDPVLYTQILGHAAINDAFSSSLLGVPAFTYHREKGHMIYDEEKQGYQRQSGVDAEERPPLFAPLPVGEILTELVHDHGVRPSISTISNLLEAEHPFCHNPERLRKILECALYLAREAAESSSADDITEETDKNHHGDNLNGTSNLYRMDAGFLEQLFVMCGRWGNPDLIMMAWDFVDHLGYPPTEGMYESTIQVFLGAKHSDQHAFAVMLEMEQEQGIKPSRALIRNVSRFMR
jgi:hypothetical protein